MKKDIDQAAAKTELHDAGKENFATALDKTDELAKTLGLIGTPGIIVMPTTGATPKNITVIAGAVTDETSKAATEKIFRPL